MFLRPFSCFLNALLVTHISEFPISILVVGGGAGEFRPLLPEGGQLVQKMGGATSNYCGEQSASAHVNIPTSTIALHTPAPLSVTFSEEKGNTPSSTQAPECIKWLLNFALKRKLCCVNYTRTMTQCMTLKCVKFNQIK